MNDAQKHDLNDIEDLAVSDKWKERFRLLQKAGHFNGLTYSNYQDLSYKERRKIGFNFLAFLLGIFYYLAKGLWKKGLVLLSLFSAISTIIVLIETSLGVTFPWSFFPIVVGIIYGTLANYDYYSLKVKGIEMWQPFRGLSHASAVIAVTLVASSVFFGALSMQEQVGNKIGNPFDDISAIWRTDDGELLEIRFNNQPPYFIYNGQQIPVQVRNVDDNNEIITIDLDPSEGDQLWSFRKVVDQDASFTYQLITDEGQLVNLSFVRVND
jgi:hypothetical protein